MLRVFEIDIERGSNCGVNLKIITAIENPPVIARILAHRGLPTRAPPHKRRRFRATYVRANAQNRATSGPRKLMNAPSHPPKSAIFTK